MWWGWGGGGVDLSDTRSHRDHIEWCADIVGGGGGGGDCVCVCVGVIYLTGSMLNGILIVCVCVSGGVISLTGSMLNGMLRLIVILIVCVCVGGGGGGDQSHRVHVEWYAETDCDTDSVCVCVCRGGEVISLTGSMLNGMLRLIVILIVCVCV